MDEDESDPSAYITRVKCAISRYWHTCGYWHSTIYGHMVIPCNKLVRTQKFLHAASAIYHELLYIVYSGARVTDVPNIIYNNILVTCSAWFGASLSSRNMFSLFVELILKLSFAISPLSVYTCVTNLYRQ